MKYSTYSYTAISFAIAFIFLMKYDSILNKDFHIIKNEIEQVSKNLKISEHIHFSNFKQNSKKKKSYSNLVKEYEELKRYTLLYIEKSPIIEPEIFESKNEGMAFSGGQFFEMAKKSDEVSLAKNYTYMALIEHLNHQSDLIKTPTIDLNYSTSLITMNEPISYHVGKVYPLYFSAINEIKKSDFNKLKLMKDQKQMDFSKFPLTFDKSQNKLNFTVTAPNEIDYYFSDNIGTRFHEGNQFDKP